MKGPRYKHETAPTPISAQGTSTLTAVRAACDSGYETGGRMREGTLLRERPPRGDASRPVRL